MVIIANVESVFVCLIIGHLQNACSWIGMKKLHPNFCLFAIYHLVHVCKRFHLHMFILFLVFNFFFYAATVIWKQKIKNITTKYCSNLLKIMILVGTIYFSYICICILHLEFSIPVYMIFSLHSCNFICKMFGDHLLVFDCNSLHFQLSCTLIVTN